jgi:hypothetical protein
VSGSKYKERGFKIFRGNVQHKDRSEALSRRLASFDCYRRECCANAAIIIDELQD